MRLIRHVSLCILHSAFCIALALAAAVLPAAQPGTATLTVSGYTGTSTLADFPVLVRVPSAITLQCGPDGSALPDIGCYECQERTPCSTTILLR